ncbi:signal peptidase I [Chloroflexota bacterium]
MKRFIKYLSTSLLVLVMLMAMIVLLAPHFGWQINTAVSNSMTPVFKAGGLVVTQPVELVDIKIGDIITFNSPIDGKLLTHRVVDISEHDTFLFQTKGDANEDPDPYLVPAQNIVGRVFFYSPLIGYATQFIKSYLGLTLLLIIPGLILILMELRNIWRVLYKKQIERKYRIRHANGD